MVTVKEVLERVEPHDQPILDLLMVDRNEMTMIQIANHLKRARLDVLGSIERLRVGGHIKMSQPYRKWYAVNYDFYSEVIAKRPDEVSEQIKALVEENARLKAEKDKLLQLSERVVLPALTLAKQDYPLSSIAVMALTDWESYIDSIREYPFG